jgi:nucleotide-binding universal stress UspA family protein
MPALLSLPPLAASGVDHRLDRVERVEIGATLTPAGERVLEAGVAFARAVHASPFLVHVLPPAADAARREERLRRLSAEARQAGGDLEVGAVLREAGEPASVLLSLAATPGSAVVVGAHESAGVLGKRLGDTTSTLLSRATGPLLIVRGRASFPPARALVYFPDRGAGLDRALLWLGAGSGGQNAETVIVALGRSARRLEALCRSLQPDLVTLALPERGGPLGWWRRRWTRRLAGRVETSVLLVPT